MIKHVLLAGAMIAAGPALAQTAPRTPNPQAEPQVTEPMTRPSGAPVTPSDPASTAQTGAQPSPADATAQAAQPSASGAQVANVVASQFGTYDKNGDGKLSKAEFGDWMTALKQASDPSAKPDAAYNTAAFAQADKDKNRTVSKSEAEKFLGAGQS